MGFNLVRKRRATGKTPIVLPTNATSTAQYAGSTSVTSYSLLSSAQASNGQVGDVVLLFWTCDGGRTIASTSTGVTRAFSISTDPNIAIFRYTQPNLNSQIATFTNGGASEDWAVNKIITRDIEPDDTKWIKTATNIATGGSITPPALTVPDNKEYLWIGIIATASRASNSTPPAGWTQLSIATSTTLTSGAGMTTIFKVAKASSMTFPSASYAASVSSRVMSLAIPGAA